jgi:hypothetical protein
MSWLNIFRKNESALSKLSNKVFEKSLLCAETLKPDLEEKFGKDSKEFSLKYIPVLLEFMCFFLHLTDRYALNLLGHEKRDKLIDELCPSTIDVMTQRLCGHWPTSSKDQLRKDFLDRFNSAQIEYGSCKELLLKPEDDTPAMQKLMSGAKSKSMVGQLTDFLSRIIKGEINVNAFFAVQVWGAVMGTLEKKEIHALVPEASREIK